MVNEQRMDKVFQALSDATRRQMIARIAVAGLTIAQLASAFPMSMPAVLKHVTVLEQAGLVTTKKVGRTRTCQLRREGLEEAAVWMERYTKHWESALDRLQALLESEGEKS